MTQPRLARRAAASRFCIEGARFGGRPAAVVRTAPRAREVGALVTGIDLAPGLIELAKRLSDLSGIPVDFAVADALKLPFADTRFDVVNAAPNIKDKPRLYVQMRRVLRPGGRMAMHDLVQGPNPGPLHMPVPEADNEDERSLASSSFAIWARRCDAA